MQKSYHRANKPKRLYHYYARTRGFQKAQMKAEFYIGTQIKVADINYGDLGVNFNSTTQGFTWSNKTKNLRRNSGSLVCNTNKRGGCTTIRHVESIHTFITNAQLDRVLERSDQTDEPNKNVLPDPGSRALIARIRGSCSAWSIWHHHRSGLQQTGRNL